MTEILETFPRVFCFPKSRINENGGKNRKTRLFVLYLQNYAARALPILFNTPKKFPAQIKLPKEILAKFSYRKKSQNQKFQTQKNPSIIPATWNPGYPPLSYMPSLYLKPSLSWSKDSQGSVTFQKNLMISLNYSFLNNLLGHLYFTKSTCRWLRNQSGLPFLAGAVAASTSEPWKKEVAQLQTTCT